ncbi:GNAT family N-acetyltransferase [Thaumasiovibrio sp. DFM-14]|uniref:GNAT family N-acetyltransferase n=1 Tax=Thaumasiovibrio sp. DFM-14 TaxID=3384792 RepID=UPI0039A0AC01
MHIVKVNNENLHIYLNLAQAYEGEFSKIMNKKPNQNGIFPLDTQLGGNVCGYLLYVDGTPAGHTAIAINKPAQYEVCDFYIVPFFRQARLGQRFIVEMFNKFRGHWQIKQVEGASHAVRFWREVIGSYTSGHYTEDVYLDPHWGLVTRQQFDNAESDGIKRQERGR